MKRSLVFSFGLILGGSVYGCAPTEGGGPVTGTGGATGTGGSSQGTGGSTPQGTGGMTSTGGSSSGGSLGSSGGTTGSGGSVGSGGSNANTGGSGDPGTGGTAGSAGGRSGTGGAAGGRSGTGGGGGGGVGSGGMGMAGGTGTLPTVAELFPAMAPLGSLDGRLALMPCAENNASGTDCKPTGYYATAGSTTVSRFDCVGNSFTLDQVFPVAGETGKTYTVTIHVYGVAEPFNYGTNNVTKDAGSGRPGNQDTGATPTSWASAPGGHTFNPADYNTYEIRSCRTRACAAADETNVYYLNADNATGHWTYVMNYEKPIIVTGGGGVRVRNFDRNCRQIKNCGVNGTPNNQCATVANARRITGVTSAMPAPSASAAPQGGLLQPQLLMERDAGNAGQWLLIDVVKVDSVR